jgi:TnpA family transposase
MRKMIAGCLIVLSLGAGVERVAAQSGATEETKKAGEAAKEAGKDTADAAKHAGKATAKAAKKGAKTVKKAVTGDAHATCVDGTRQAGKTEAAAAAACSSHGGVAKQ